LLGLLSLGALPTALTLLMQNASSFSIDSLFTRLAFNKKRLALSSLKSIITHAESSDLLKRDESLLHAGKTLCIRETDLNLPEKNEEFASIYQQTNNGFNKVASLNQMELMAMNKMADRLSSHHGISDPKQLKKMLVPVLRTRYHKSTANFVETEYTSPVGFYTENGYCSIKIHGKGSYACIKTSILDFRKEVLYQDNFNIHHLS
jgi:hypothetical protein